MAVPGAKVGDAWINLNVDASKVGPEMEASVDTALAGVVETADVAMAEVGATAEATAAKVSAAFEESSKAQQQSWLRAASSAESASARVVAAQNAQRDATAALATAEADLAAARAAGDEEKIVTAEADLARARGKAEVATSRLTAAEATERKTKADLAIETEALGNKQEGAAAKSMAAAEGIKSKWTGMASLVAGATAALLVKSAGDYQQQLTKLATTAGESTKNLKFVGDGMLAMAGQVGISAQHLSVGMYTVESAGFHGADGLTVLKAAAQGAKQENADLEKVTDAVTTALHDYSLPASDAATVTSQLITAVSHGKTTFDALTGSMHSVTPLAASMKMSLAETAGALSAMTASGMSADQASQNLADALRHLQTPTAPMTAQLAQLGITSSDLAESLGKKGLAATVQEISGAIVDHLDPATKKVLLPALNQSKTAANDLKVMMAAMPPELRKSSQALLDGGNDIASYTKEAKAMGGHLGPMATQFLGLYKSSQGFSNILKSGTPAAQTYTSALQKSMGTVAGLSVALQLTGEHADGVNASIKDIAAAVPEADGSIKGWSEVQGNFNQKVAQTVNGIKSWGIEMGQKLLPVATSLVGVVQGLVEWLTKHKTIATILVSTVAGLAAAWLSVKAAQALWKAGSDLVGAGKQVIDLAKKTAAYFLVVEEGATTTKAAALGQKAWNIVMGESGIVQGIVTAATWAWNAALDANPVMLIVLAVVALIAGIWLLITHFKWAKDAAHAVWDAIKSVGEWFATVGKAIGSWASDTWDKVVGFFSRLPGMVGDWLSKLPGEVGRALLGLLTALVDFDVKVLMFFVTLPIKIAIVLGVLVVKIGQAFVAAFTYLKTNVPKWIGDVVQFFRELPGKVLDALQALGGRIASVFMAAFTYLRTNVPVWIGNVIQFFRDLPGKAGSALASLGRTIGGAFSAAVAWARSTAVNGFNSIVSWISGLPGRLGSLAGSMVSAGGRLMSSLLSGLANAGSGALDIGRKVVNAIIGFINTHVIDNIDSALNFSVMGVSVHAGNIPHIPMLANGGVIDRPTLAIVGEAGPEAVVPLTRPGRAAQVMRDAGLGGATAGGDTHITWAPNISVPTIPTAAEAAAILEQDWSRAMRLGLRTGVLGAALGVTT